jgi:hypothetical protein
MDLYMTRSQAKSLVLCFCSLAGATVLTGCASSQQQASLNSINQQPAQLLSVAMSQQLTNAKPGQQLIIQESPWGADTQLQITERYFAASGRTCLKFTVHQTGHFHIACSDKSARGQWFLNPNIFTVTFQE